MCKYEAEYSSNKDAVSSVLAALTAIFEWQEEGGEYVFIGDQFVRL